MEPHPYFDLWIHSTDELSALLSANITERVTLQEWPLSFVQRITLSNGKKLIYKVQALEGVEPCFYAHVESPLLPSYRSLGLFNHSAAMLFEYIEAPTLKDLSLSEAQILHHGRALVKAVQAMPDSVPLYADLGNLSRWQEFVNETLTKLSALIETGKFRKIRPDTITQLAAWAATGSVRSAFQSKSVITHADLSGGNVFLTTNGYKIIDWQFPRRLPDGFDLAVYLDFMGVNPHNYVDPAVINIAWFVRVGWYVHSQADLFPNGDRYEAFVAKSADRILDHEFNR